MKTFVIVKDGVARIMTAQDNVADAWDEIKKWHPDDQAKVSSVREISDADIPANRSISLRNAWEDDGSAIVVNLAKARPGKVNEFRLERNRRLEALDVDYIRADEAGDTALKENIAMLKQKLRDLPVTIESELSDLNTPAEIESFTPTWPSLD